MSNRTLFILALVAVAACALVYFAKDRPGTAASLEQERYVFNLKADQVDRVELTNPAGAFTFVRKAGGGWDMESPMAYPADASAVGTFLSDLEFAQRKGVVRREGETEFDELLGRFGLADPRLRVRVFEGRQVRSLAVGSQTARSGIFYALVEQGPKKEIVLIDSLLEGQLTEGTDHWRSREVADFSPADVEEVVTRDGAREFAMKKSNGSWQITRPLDLEADPARVTRFLTNLRQLRVEQFVAEAGADLSEFGFSPPSGMIEIKADKGSQTILLGSKVAGNPSQIYAQPPGYGNVVTLSAEVVGNLLDLLARVRPRNVLAWPLDQTPQAIEVTAGPETFELVREEGSAGSWRIKRGDWESAGDPNLVQQFLASLRALEALEFLETRENPNPAYGLARPTAVVAVEFPESANLPPKQTLRFGATRQGETFVESSQVPFVVTVAQSFLDTLPKHPWDLLGQEVQVADPKAITRVAWQGGGAAMSVERNAEGNWSASGNTEPFDEMFFIQQTEMLGNLVAKEWLGVPGPRDFARPQLTLAVAEGDKEKKLLFGARRPDGSVPVRVEGEPFAFAIPEDTFKALALRPVTQAPTKPGETR